MAIITRIFPAQRRGQAMALWGATAGVATLVGPILGGVLVDSLGWEWIFFINIPVGIVGFVLAWRLVPRLETHMHRFDWLGVVLSGLGMFLLVFGIQEGHQYDWGTITGVITVPALIVAGLRGVRGVPGLAGPQPTRAAGAAAAVPRPQLLAGQPRHLDDGLRDHRDGLPAHALRPARARPLPDPVRAAAGADGGHVRSCWRRPSASSPTGSTRGPSPAVGFTAIVVVAGLAVPGDDARLRDLGAAARRWCCSASATPCVWAPLSATATRNLPLQRPAPARASTTPPGRSARCSARPPSPSSWTPGSPPTAWRSQPTEATGGAADAGAGARRVQRGDGRRRCCCRPLVLLIGLVGGAVLRAVPGPPAEPSRPAPAPADGRRVGRSGGDAGARCCERFSQASTTRAAMPASAALPQARGS